MSKIFKLGLLATLIVGTSAIADTEYTCPDPSLVKGAYTADIGGFKNGYAHALDVNFVGAVVGQGKFACFYNSPFWKINVPMRKEIGDKNCSFKSGKDSCSVSDFKECVLTCKSS